MRETTPKERSITLEDWLASITKLELSDIRPASSDASFRCYYRVTDADTQHTYIVMDAPPDKEDCRPFVRIARLLAAADVNAPRIIEADEDNGFLLLSDLGETQYLDRLDASSADDLYKDALHALVKMQTITADLPAYDRDRLMEEMSLFETWYLGVHLRVDLPTDDRTTLMRTLEILVDNALAQPQVFVHRDYHSRNLMLTSDDNPGVIDFQDAVIGPITYDLVSLFKDCYIEWSRPQIEAWLDDYRRMSTHTFDREQFLRWFDLMGVQRHLKVLGIFCRLNYRDGKARYLDDLPLTLKYVIDACERYPELDDLTALLQRYANAAYQVANA